MTSQRSCTLSRYGGLASFVSSAVSRLKICKAVLVGDIAVGRSCSAHRYVLQPELFLGNHSSQTTAAFADLRVVLWKLLCTCFVMCLQGGGGS